jgi:hypothetical protein
MKTYVIGDIPPLTCIAGQVSVYQLNSDETGTPVDTVMFDSDEHSDLYESWISLDSGILTVTPGEDRGGQFLLTAKAGEKSQNFLCFVSKETPPGYDDLSNHAATTLDPASLDYVNLVYKKNADSSLVSLAITANDLVLDSSNDNVLKKINSRTEPVGTLIIYARTVRIGEQLTLPGASIQIFCRDISFAGNGKIDVTPKEPLAGAPAVPAKPESQGSPAEPRKPAGNGKDGQSAGSIELFIYSYQGDGKRLVMNGGVGGAPGAGFDGPNGFKASVTKQPFKNVGTNLSDLSVIPNTVRASLRDPLTGKSKIVYPKQYDALTFKLPSNGKAAEPAGRPGIGGDGGTLTSTVHLEESNFEFNGGTSGIKGSPYTGGAAGVPNPYRTASASTVTIMGVRRIDAGSLTFKLTSLKAGANAVALDALKPSGKVGLYRNEPASSAWIQPNWLSAFLRYMHDCLWFSDYKSLKAAILEYIEIRPLIQERSDCVAVMAEIESVLARYFSGLDLHGNPNGWYPRLSLLSSLDNYKNEIAFNSKIVASMMWCLNEVSRVNTDRESMYKAIDILQSRFSLISDEFSELDGTYPGLQVQFTNVNNEMTSLKEAIRQETLSLQAQAEVDANAKNNRACWRKSLQVIGTVMTMIPVYQPALAAVGTGLQVASKIGEESAGDSIKTLGDAASNTALAGKSKKFITEAEGVQFKKADTIKNAVSSGKAFLEEAQKTFAQINGILHDKAASPSEINSIFETLKARSPELKDLIRQSEKICSTQGVLAQKLTDHISRTVQLANELTNIGEALMAFDEKVALLPLVSLSELSQNFNIIRQRADYRLEYYRYLVRKSYEYLFLQNCPLEPRSVDLIDKLKLVILENQSKPLSDFTEIAEAQKNIFESEFREVVFAIRKMFSDGAITTSRSWANLTLSPDEIAVLNAEGVVKRNLVQTIGGEFDNVRLVDISVEDTNEDFGAIAEDGADLDSFVRVYVRHTSESVIRKNDRIYHFQNGDNPYSWVFWKECTPGEGEHEGDISQSEPASELIELLQFLESSSSQISNSKLELFAAPGLDSELLFSLERANARLTKLKLRIDFNYDPQDANIVWLNSGPGNNFKTNVSFSENDLREKNIAFDKCWRCFYKKDDAKVVLSVPRKIGNRKFSHWTVNGKRTDDFELQIKLDKNRFVRYFYEELL